MSPQSLSVSLVNFSSYISVFFSVFMPKFKDSICSSDYYRVSVHVYLNYHDV